MMSQSSYKRRKVSSVREFPLGCNTQSTVKGSDDVAVISETTKENFKQQKVSSVREFPLGFKTRSTSVKNELGSDDVAVKSENVNGYQDSKCVGVVHRNYHRREEVESFDSFMKKAGFDVAANGKVGDGKYPPAKRKFTPFCGSKVKPLSSEEGIQLISSERERRRFLSRKPLLVKAVQKHRNSPAKHRNSPAKKTALRLRANAHKPTQHRDERLSPRDEVRKVLSHFKVKFKELDRDKAARRVTSKTVLNRTDYKARAALIESGMQVNCEKMIGPVPGIQIGDGFQFKVELNIIGLHFGIRGGIDYMKKGNMELATSIVSAEGNGYIDRYDSDVLIYCGQGGNKDQKVIEDQKLVAGNMALVNSMRKMTPVRVILGKRRLDQRGRKNYVYDGLYMVQDYWREKGPHGYMVFMFKLSRVPGQPYPYVEF